MDAEAVEREWGSVLTAVRSSCLAIPSRVGSRLPHLSPADLVEVEVEVRAVLTALAEDKGELISGDHGVGRDKGQAARGRHAE